MVIQQLANTVTNALGGNANGSKSQLGSQTPTYRGKRGYPRTLRTSDFFSGQVNISTGKFEELGKFIVGAKQFAEVGFGDPTLDPQEQGRPQIDLQDGSSNVIEGTIRVTHESAQGTQEFKILEKPLDTLREGTRSERLVQPRASTAGYPRVGEDSKIGLFVNATNNQNGNVDDANSTVRLPVTIYE